MSNHRGLRYLSKEARGPRVTQEVLLLWGEAVATQSEAINEQTQALQQDLMAVVTDLEKGPVAYLAQQAQEYLGELRREFLRHHRRLVVQSRVQTEDQAALVRRELAELALRFRALALGRSSKLGHIAWSSNDFYDVIDRRVDLLPVVVEAPYEPENVAPRSDDSWWRALRRGGLRGRLWVARAVSIAPTRSVGMRALARYHLSGLPVSKVEGVAVLLLQVEGQLSGRSRHALESTLGGFEALVGAESMAEALVALKRQVDEEFALIESDIQKLSQEATKRIAGILGEAMRSLKEDLRRVGTPDLPSWRRRSQRRLAQRARLGQLMESTLNRAFEVVAASYVHLGLHLELTAFEARVRQVVEDFVADLEQDARGRSRVQVDRVHETVEQVLTSLDQATANDGLEDLLEPLERVLGEALRAAQQLLEQLSAEVGISPLLEAINREAQGLTDRYRVPASRLPHAEWKLPEVPALVEVPLAEIVGTYVQGEIAPQLLAAAAASSETVQQLLAQLSELERVVGFNSEQFATDIEMVDAQSIDLGTPAQVRAALKGALRRSLAADEPLREKLDLWSAGLADDIRRVVAAELAELRRRLGEGEVGRLRMGRARALATRRRFEGQVDQLFARVERASKDGARALRNLVGEDRIESWRLELGLPGAEREAVDASAFVAPRRGQEVPLVYRRLFASPSHWAGDGLDFLELAINRAREALAGHPGALLRTVALVGAEGSGKGALAASIARGERWTGISRVAFSRPADIGDVEDQLSELGSGELVVLNGLQWLAAARPGGFEPLRRLLERIVGDAGRNAWLLEADDIAWRFACAGTGLADIFGEIVQVPPLGLSELRQAVLARHQLSGFELVFESATVSVSKGMTRAVAPEAYFRALHAASGGLLQSALALWLASVVRVDESAGKVHLGPVPRAPYDALRRLPEPALLLLLQVKRQGWMDASTLAFLYRMEAARAEGQLSRLAHWGILERTGSAYQIRRHLRGSLAKVLGERGWL